ncbi:MAG: hypothetical protein NC094_08955 [Bacteroidales bacterium]|nr:hypothetical protein [Lachnoclostridium sp.]MCM1385132.1 hypothetical protein [Lachnoclostridium sp.]MCM1465534.1 hypothetical protein [Bacteroidales bacterium]
METKLKRNKDGTIEGILTMGDMLKKEEPSADEKKIREIKEQYEKKYKNTFKE